MKIKSRLGCLLALMLLLTLVPVHAGGPGLSLQPVGETHVNVYSPDESFSFEVEVINGTPDVKIEWVQCNDLGQPITGDIGYGGTAFLMHGIPAEKMGELLYYKCIATRSDERAECTFSCMLLPMGVEEEGMTLVPVSPQHIEVYSPDEEIAFEIKAVGAKGELKWTSWYECDENGVIRGGDIGFGGTALVLHGIPAEKMEQTQYYACIVRDSGGNEALFVFSCVLLPMGVEEEEGLTLSAVGEQNVVVHSTEEPFSFEVQAAGAKGALQWTAWYECNPDGSIRGGDIGNGGTALYMHGLPADTKDGQTLTYGCIVRDSGGNEALLNFTVRLELSGGEEDDDAVVGIGISTPPKKMTYKVGETLDLTGLSVRIWTGNGFMDRQNGADMHVTPMTLTTAGQQVVTVEYEGFADTFTVEVQPGETKEEMVSVSIVEFPAKMKYVQGETLDLYGLVVQVRTTQRAWESKNGEGLTVTPTVLNTVGTQSVTVSYNDFADMFTVTVTAKPAETTAAPAVTTAPADTTPAVTTAPADTTPAVTTAPADTTPAVTTAPADTTPAVTTAPADTAPADTDKPADTTADLSEILDASVRDTAATLKKALIPAAILVGGAGIGIGAAILILRRRH